jgi:hypothetical protein
MLTGRWRTVNPKDWGHCQRPKTNVVPEQIAASDASRPQGQTLISSGCMPDRELIANPIVGSRESVVPQPNKHQVTASRLSELPNHV